MTMVYLTSPSSSGCSGLSIPYCLCLYVFFAAMMTSNMLVAGNTEEAVIRAQGSVHIHPDDNNLAVGSVSYGVDVSWPMHHETTTRHAPNPLGADERQYAYKEYLQGCVGDETQSTNYLTECRQWESDRIGMNLRQPSISQNYTHAGFAKVETPPVVQQLLQNVWEEHFESQVVELWEHGNTYLNHWQSPTHMVDVSRILSEAEQWELVKVVQKVLEAWTQQPLILTSTYGIRVYGDGAILAPHVDRLPLVTSAIINVAQDVDEPWVLEVVGHDGKATNITMEPGDMVLYESHSVIHGRPFPLKGKYYANLFVHFEPVGHSFRHMQSHPQTSPKEAYERALARQQERRAAKESEPFTLEFTYGEEEFVDDAPTASLPAYVPPEKETRWRQQFEYEREPQVAPKPTRATLGHINAHFAAADGMLDLLKEIAAKDRSQLFKKDQNGWRPLHEAARGGRADVLEYLLKEGAQVNERPNAAEGGTPLWWAERKPKENAKAIAVLKKYGGVSLAPIPAKDRKAKDANKKAQEEDDSKAKATD